MIELNGVSNINFVFSSSFSLLIPISAPANNKALSVGRPLTIHSSPFSSGFSIKASLHKDPIFKANSLSEAITSETLIFPSVKVPVLSVAIIEVLPRVSVEDNFLTNPCFFKILCIPIAKITVIATGNPSGIAATETATAVENISIISSPLIIPSKKIKTLITAMIVPIIKENLESFFCRGVFSSIVFLTISATFPISVLIPV